MLHLVYEFAESNNGMHPTRDTTVLIRSGGVGGRVMPGVQRLSSE